MNEQPNHVDRREGTVVVDGLRLHWCDAGDPAAPAVLLLHGMMGNAREWDVAVDDLAATYRVVTFDQRGHGRSDRAGVYAPGPMAADAAAVVEALGLAPAVVVGHSMGAAVAMVLAAERPDLVDRLVVVDLGPDTFTTEFAAGMPGFLAVLGDASYESVDEAVDFWTDGDLFARRELVDHWAAHNLVRGDDGRWRWCFDADGLAGFGPATSEAELWAAFEGSPAPKLVIRGRHSPVLSPATAARLATVPGTSVVEIDAAAHDLGVQRPEAVAQAVRAFLSPLSPLAPSVLAPAVAGWR